jgi:tRNA-uridine 2-sulfurtransferase
MTPRPVLRSRFVSTSGRRIVVAMSGGVDSSVAAALLLSQGWEPIGVTLHLWDYPDDAVVRGRCCAPEDLHDARRVCDHLGIPHYSFDRREMFAERVIDPFVSAYLSGETPSPCVTCNRLVKMAELFALADSLGASKVATGHYARIVHRDDTLELHRGQDLGKDQSYFLHVLSDVQLGKLELPLSEMTKAEVRAEAVRLGLPGAGKGESQELCFVPTGRYDAFVERRAGSTIRPGTLTDASGRVVGTHAGVHKFTIGQRKRLGVALGTPAFVVSIDPAAAVVRLGSENELFCTGAVIKDVHFFDGVTFPRQASVQVRYRHEGTKATITREGSSVSVRFDTPVRAVAKGQAAVAYDGSRVLGGGTIERVITEATC